MAEKILSLLKDAEKKINTQTEQYRKNSNNNNSSGEKKKIFEGQIHRNGMKKWKKSNDNYGPKIKLFISNTHSWCCRCHRVAFFSRYVVYWSMEGLKEENVKSSNRRRKYEEINCEKSIEKLRGGWDWRWKWVYG